MRIDQIAVQLYAVRAQTADDMTGTLRQLAEMGYRAVEFAGYGNSAPGEIRSTLDELGVRAISAHVALTRVEQELSVVISEMQTLGCSAVVVPSVPEERRSSAEQVRRLAEKLNDAGKQLAQAGLQLGYHNHQFEFAPLDGTTMWDLLVAETDPSLVRLELDVYWAMIGGRDPVELLRRNGARVSLLHLKDPARETGRTRPPAGMESLPWQTVLAAADAAGTEWYIVEQDNPSNPLEDVRGALRQLESWGRS